MKQAIPAIVLALTAMGAGPALGQHEMLPGAPAASRPAVTGGLAVKVAQGTRDGPKVAGDRVLVELYCQHGQVEQKFERTLDEHGVATVEGIALTEAMQPVVTVTHAGVPYRAMGQPMGEALLNQRIDVTVYETTTTPPAWTIGMRHLVLDAMPGGLVVGDILIVNTPGDRTYVGPASGPDTGVTMLLPCPPGARSVQLIEDITGPAPAKLAGGQVVCSLPLTPGMMRLHVRSILPIVDRKVNVDLPTPVDIARTLIFTPAAGMELQAQGLKPMKGQPDGMRAYSAPATPAGKHLLLGVTLTEPPASRPDEKTAGKPWGTPQWLAVAGGGFLLVLCAAALWLRPSRAKGPQDPQRPTPGAA